MAGRMSGIKKEEPENTVTAPRIPFRTLPDQTEVYTGNAPQNTPEGRVRNSVENTTREPHSQNNDDPKEPTGDLVENTTGDPTTTSVGKGRVEENTSSTPLEPTEEEQRKLRRYISQNMSILDESPRKRNDILKGVLKGASSMTTEEEEENGDRVITAEVKKEIDREIIVEMAEEKYKEMCTRKDYYKNKTVDLERMIDELEEEIKNERERELCEKQTRNEATEVLLNTTEAVRDKARRMEEKLEKLKRVHEIDMAQMMENQVVHCELEINRRLRAEERVAELEREIKEVRTNYHRILRNRDSELTRAQRIREDNENVLAERERINKNLWETIATQREELEIKDIEIGAYKEHNQQGGEKNTSQHQTWQIPSHCIDNNNNGRINRPDQRRQGKRENNLGAHSNPIPYYRPRELKPIPYYRPRDQSIKDIQGRRNFQDWEYINKAGPSGNRGYQQWEQDAWEDQHYKEQPWDQYWERKYKNQQQYPRPLKDPQNSEQQPRERDQKDLRDRGRGRGAQNQEDDHWESQKRYSFKEYMDKTLRKDQVDRKRDDSEIRYREVPRDRQGERVQRGRSMSPRNQRERSPSPLSNGKGRGEEQREREYDIWSNNGRGRGGESGRRGEDASYGGS